LRLLDVFVDDGLRVPDRQEAHEVTTDDRQGTGRDRISERVNSADLVW
jgi:hypothetical protein